MVATVTYILNKEDLCLSLSIHMDTLVAFLSKIQGGYKDITYHNKTHATDLAQTIYYMMTTCELKKKCKIDELEMTALIIAGACHDHEHP